MDRLTGVLAASGKRHGLLIEHRDGRQWTFFKFLLWSAELELETDAFLGSVTRH
ncbi:hypothetical protein [Novosphingobium sp.]|uniref:hypothetical protein n=1 Tax=Novosphingobium sp. TaxID=1874826 RepID=UPI00261A47BC|nr:hypothetical protein [Novosphingobium sp.]